MKSERPEQTIAATAQATGWVMLARAAAVSSAPVAAQILLVLPHQEVRTEFGDPGGAHLRHAEVDLAAEDAERLGGAGHAAGRHAIKSRAALEDELRPHADRDQRIEPAPDATVEHQGHLVADRIAN